jgi:hypothetical protein
MLKIWKKKENTKTWQGIIQAERAQPEDDLVALPEQLSCMAHAQT